MSASRPGHPAFKKQVKPMKPEEIRIGYLLISTPLPNTYLGGIMVTDGRGLPVEFRYTEPIQPTKIQQVLYGQVLSQYIKREVIVETLIKGIESKFKNLLIEDEQLLPCDGKSFVFMRISETKTPAIGEAGCIKEVSPGEFLLQTAKENSPLRIQLPEKKPELQKTEPEFETLISAGHWMDIHEPIQRIEKALEIICQETGILQKSPLGSD